MMRREKFLLILAGFLTFSFLTESVAQNPYSMLLDSTYIHNWDKTAQKWDLSKKEKFEYVYGTDNKLVEMGQFDSAGNLISIDSRSYTDSSMTRILTKPYDGSWINWLKYFTLYNEMNKEVYSETYTWVNNEWTRADKVIWKYENDKLVQLIRNYLYNGLFQPVLQIDYIYDQDSRLTEYIITNLITQTPVSRILYTNNDLGQRIEGLKQNWQNGQWINSGKLIYSYNNCGTLQEIINQVFVNDIFTNSTRTQLFYSPHFFESNTKKVAICHNGHTIYVSKNAVSAHLAHGDCIGECTVEQKPERRGFDDKEQSEKPPFTIYPNPAKDKITIKFDNEICAGPARIELADSYGKIIRSFKIKDFNDLTIYRGNLLSGSYYLRFHSDRVYGAVVIFE